MKKFILALAGIVIVAGFIYIGFIKDKDTSIKENSTTTSGNNEEPTTDGSQNTIGNKVNFDGFSVDSQLNSLSKEMISLGYSKTDCDRDEFNRPKVIENIQNQYGDKYNSVFIGDESKKVIYLTFTTGYEYYNDGVSNTDVIMNTLKSKNVPAIFFVDGGYVRNNAQMCQKIVNNGFKLGCHGWDHPSEGVASYPLDKQIEDAKQIYTNIYDITGVEPYLYRFGSGIWNEQALSLLNELGFKNVFYSFTYFDYDTSNQPDEASSLQSMIDNLHNGEILYLHTVSNTSMNILASFIDEARAKGFEFGIIE